MVIDDELDICIMLKVVLESNGFIANYYSNPIVALDEFKSNFYDLIILDIQMSDINGMQLYREIRKRDIKTKICHSHPHLPTRCTNRLWHFYKI